MSSTPATVPVYRPSFDARSSALSYGSRLILEQLGLWPTLSEHLSAIESIHVSDRGRFGSTAMNCDELQWPALGYVVENAWLGTVLMSAVREQPGIEFCSPATVAQINPRQQGVEVVIDDGAEPKTLHAQLVVIADGADSGLRKQLGIEAKVEDYHQTALIANVCFRKHHQHCAYERFTDEGPMALLPLADSEKGEPRSALVWTLPTEQAQQLCECDDGVFLAKLQQRFGNRQGQFTRVGERFSYPLRLIEAQEQVRSGVVVMGNAAHSLHPVAGQGFNLALRDCTCLTEMLLAARDQGQALGSLSVLQAYQTQQQFDQHKTVLFSDRVTALFSNRQLGLSLLRGFGLFGLDMSTSAKQQFVRHAAGVNDGAVTGVNYANQ